jgi:hypothetical protein
MLVHPELGEPQLHYLRHFVLLGLMAVVLLSVAKPLYALREHASSLISGFDAQFVLYGLLHALAVAVSLRGRRPFWRPAAFVLAAPLLNVGVLHLGTAIVHGEALSSAGWLVILAPACLGAIAYALLTRLVLRFRWAWLALAPVAGLVGAVAGILGTRLVSDFTVLAAAWWFAFSAWIYCADQWLALVARARESAR